MGRPPRIAGGPLNTPITPASALHPGGDSMYARDGHAPWQALEEVLGALEGGHAVTFASGMSAAAALTRLFGESPIVVAPEVAYKAPPPPSSRRSPDA